MAEYIEKKDALEAISKIEFIAMDCVAAAGVNDAFQLVVRYMEHQLKKLPAADVRPVVRGKWVTPTVIDGRAFNIPHCSACNGVPCGVDEHTNFCPNCGAMMEES